MARIRSIKPEYWTDEKIVHLPYEARLFYIGLWNFADDCGHVEDEPLRLKLQVLPNDDVDAKSLIETLVSVGLLFRLRGCLVIPNFRKHQRIDKPSTCRFSEDSTKAPRGSRKPPGVPASPPPRKGRDGSGGDRNGRDKPPPPAEDGTTFDQFWQSYPTRNGSKGSKKNAVTEWTKLDPGKRTEAAKNASLYALSVGDFPKDAERYLKHEMWNGLVADEVGKRNGSGYRNEQEWTAAERGLA